MGKARQCIQVYQFQQAKKYIDSIRIVNPKNYAKIKEGMQVLREIEFAEQKRTKEYCDSLLSVRQAAFPEKQKYFTYQQNKAYESIGYYVNINQLPKNNFNRTYIQAKVDEKGQLILISYYTGSNHINHDRFRIYADNGSYAETELVPRDGALNYAFKDDDLHYEIVRFNEKKMNNVVNFIALHENETLKVELIGDKRKIIYTMRDSDKKAILGAGELSSVLSDITWLLNEIRLAQAKMNYIHSKTEDASDSAK